MVAATSSTTSATSASYPASDDPLLQAAWAYFGLDGQIAQQLKYLSDRVDGLRQKLVTRNAVLDAFGKAVSQAPAADPSLRFMQVSPAERDRIVADLTEMGLIDRITVVQVSGSPGLYTFQVNRPDFDAVADTLSQGVQALLGTSQTQQLALQNEVARYSTLAQTVGSLQKSYVSLAQTAIRAIGG